MHAISDIRALTDGFSGTFGLWAHCLDTGETLDLRGDESFPAAATVQLPILYEVYRQAGAGRFHTTDLLPVRLADVAPGPGILKDLCPEVTLSVRNLAALMVVAGDHTAANMLLRLVGVANVNRSSLELGLIQTRLTGRLGKEPPGTPGNSTSPADLGRLLHVIATEQVLDPAACNEILDLLGRRQHQTGIPRPLSGPDGAEAPDPAAITVAVAGGAAPGSRSGAGLVTAHGCRYVLAMMTRGCADPRPGAENEAAQLLPAVAAAVYRHFTPGAVPRG